MKNSPQIISPVLVTNNLVFHSNRKPELSEAKSESSATILSRRVYSLQQVDQHDNSDECEIKNPRDFIVSNTLLNSEFRGKLEKIKENMLNTKNSNVPIDLKIKMMQSLRDAIQTYSNCVQETNANLKQKIEDMNNGVQTNDERFISELQAEYEEAAAKYSIIEELNQENIAQEESLAKLRQTKNSLSVSVEDSKDEMADLESLIQEKKRVLENKMKYIEELKVRISTESPKKLSNRQPLNLAQKKEENNLTPTLVQPSLRESVSEPKLNSMNTPNLLQDVSSKLTGFMGSIFSKKPVRSVLTPQIMKEISLSTKPAPVTEPKVFSRKRNPSQGASKVDPTR